MTTQTADNRQRKALAVEAALIVANAKSSRYQHDPVVDVATGTYNLDCSAFVSLVLRKVLGEHYGEIPRDKGWPCPRAHDYYDFLAGLTLDSTTNTWMRVYELDGATVKEGEPGWTLVERLVDARPGDVIAWRFKHLDQAKDTGHVLIVAERPEPGRAGIVAVRVFDSSTIPHFDDTRSPGGGVGVGTILFRTDPSSGAPMAFQFGPEDRFHAFPIVIGRPEPFRS